MNDKKALLSLLLLTCLSYAFAQEKKIEGFIFTDQKEPAELALVALHTDSITTQPDAVTYSDKKGYYQINITSAPSKKYLLEVRYIGYKATTAEFYLDSIKGSLRHDFDLITTSESSKLKEVVVTSKRRMGIDKKSYHFSREQKQRVQNSLDLALTLPQVKAEAGTGKITSATGESAPIILINGHYASHEELRSIPPSKIIRMDYFDIAPERYNTRGNVIDIITKPLDDGHHAGSELFLSPFVRDGAARLYYNYNIGAHQIKLFSHNFIRHTALGKREEQETQYTTFQQYKYESEGIVHTRLRSNLLKASYTYKQPNKQYLEISFSSSIEKSDNPHSYNAFLQVGNQKQQRIGEVANGGFVFTPIVNIYYDRTLSNSGNRLFSNIVYTHNQARTEYNLKESNPLTNTLSLEEYLKGKTSKNSLIGQIEYLHPLRKGWLYIGSLAMYSHALFRIDGISSGYLEDKQHQFRDRLYLTWEGSSGNFFYRITPAVNVHYTSAHKGLELSQTRWNFNPRLLLGYNLPKHHRLRWEVETANLIPELGQTTEAIRQVREDLFYRNNPKLQNSYATTSRIYHTWSHPYIELSNTLAYNYTSKDWILSIEKTELKGRPVIIQQQVNALYSQYATLKSAVSIKPFKNESLMIRLYAHPRYQQFRFTQKQQISLFSIPAGASITYQTNNWGVQGDVDLPHQRLHSYFTSFSGWSSSLSAFWSKNNWNIRVALENLFVPETSQTINHPFLHLQEKTNAFLRDNRWKVSLFVAYYFSVGKGYSADRFLENEDTDRGTI